MNPWDREDTREWIAQLETRIEDLQYYLSRTQQWCSENEIQSDRIIFVCSIMALVWVCHLRNENISKQELLELLKIENWESIEDATFEFNPAYEDLELEELLTIVVRSFF